MQQRRNNRSQEEHDLHLQNLRNIDHERRNNMNEAERQQFLENMRNRNNERRNNMNDMERQQFLENMRNRDHERRNNMNEMEREQFLENMRNRDQERRNNMNQQERQHHLENVRNRVQHHRNAVNIEHQIYYIGSLDVRCQFCGALRFQREQLNCCHNGKVSLPPLQEYPENLRLLFDADNAESSNFRHNIRKYNSAFAFASFGRISGLLQDVDHIVPFTRSNLPLRTFDRVGIYLPKPCFTHGQLYVAFSRARAMNSVRVKVQHLNNSTHGHTRGITFTRNIVYREVFS